MRERNSMRRSAPVDLRPFKPIERVAKQVRGETLYATYRKGKLVIVDNGGHRPILMSLPKVRGYYE